MVDGDDRIHIRSCSCPIARVAVDRRGCAVRHVRLRYGLRYTIVVAMLLGVGVPRISSGNQVQRGKRARAEALVNDSFTSLVRFPVYAAAVWRLLLVLPGSRVRQLSFVPAGMR